MGTEAIDNAKVDVCVGRRAQGDTTGDWISSMSKIHNRIQLQLEILIIWGDIVAPPDPARSSSHHRVVTLSIT